VRAVFDVWDLVLLGVVGILVIALVIEWYS